MAAPSQDSCPAVRAGKGGLGLIFPLFPWAAQEEVLTVCERQAVFKPNSSPPPWLFLMEPVFESGRSLCTVAQPQGSLAVSEGRILWCLAKFLGVTG